jgi:hypothetical protein
VLRNAQNDAQEIMVAWGKVARLVWRMQSMSSGVVQQTAGARAHVLVWRTERSNSTNKPMMTVHRHGSIVVD